jgi:predicted transcriptional regulator
MLAMPAVNYIKHLRENEDLSINEIARKTGHNWRTVKNMRMVIYLNKKLR